MTLLALKLVLAPLLVVGSSLAGRRWGPRLAGILVVLPIVAGPILLIVHLQHGRDFASRAATASTLGVAPLALFAVVVAHVSIRRGWLVTLAAGWTAVLLADLGLALLQIPAPAALVVALGALHGAGLMLRRLPASAPPPVTLPWWDLPARAMATGVLVVLLTTVAARLGPTVTGVLAPFPIALSVVCAFAVAHQGHPGVLALLRGIVPGLDGFALFCFLVAVTLDRLGGLAAFSLATTVSVGFALVLARRQPSSPGPEGPMRPT